MANDFSGDSDCVAVWRFESSPGFTSDSQGTNTLTNSGVDVETTTVYEGSQAASFVRANGDYMYIADADLDSGFPFRYDDEPTPETTFSFLFRIYLNSLPGSTIYVYSKYKTSGDLRVFATNISATDIFGFLVGYNSGASYEGVSYTTAFQTGRWYSGLQSYNSSDYSYRLSFYDHTAADYLDSDVTGNFSQAIDNRDVLFTLGSRGDEGSTLDGILDEVAVFKRIVTPSEFSDYIAGTFSYSGLIPIAMHHYTKNIGQ